MTAASSSPDWDDAVLAAQLCALDPAGIGGVALRALPGPVRDRWLALLRAQMQPGAPLRRLPLHARDERVLGGLDLPATLRAGRPVAQRGILAESDGGILVVAMAERVSAAAASRLTAALDCGEVAAERDGLAFHARARLGVVALDEGGADERPHPALLDRLALHVDLHAVGLGGIGAPIPDHVWVAAARALLAEVTAPDAVLEALCAAALALGVGSARAALLALRVARGAAALAGRRVVADQDAALAARLVLAPRATRLPVQAAEPDDAAQPRDGAEDDAEDAAREPQQQDDRTLEDRVLEAAAAALPPGLLGAQAARRAAARARAAGRAGQRQPCGLRGRPVGVRHGAPQRDGRLNLMETLRAAAPWQRLREAADRQPAGALRIRAEDLRVSRYEQRRETLTIFVVDASGSAALHRLAEAKGAVELLLADCYIRRDRVAMLTFRGRGAELLLPPTRSLARAKRSLAALPGGGGTPLAAAIDAAAMLAETARRAGQTPTIVLLTDGRANVARDGAAGRAQAEADAMAASRLIAVQGVSVVLLDTSPQPYPTAARLAAELGGRYLPLPRADAAALSRAARAA